MRLPAVLLALSPLGARAHDSSTSFMGIGRSILSLLGPRDEGDEPARIKEDAFVECAHLARFMMNEQQSFPRVCREIIDVPTIASESLWMAKKMVVQGAGGELPADSPQDARMFSAAHGMYRRFCEHTVCAEPITSLQPHIASCYAATLCNTVARKVPYDTCKSHIGHFFMSQLNISVYGLQCMKEEGTNMFCTEVIRAMMMERFDCFTEIQSPLSGCTPACSQLWRATQSKYPYCASALAQQLVRQQANIVSLVHALNPNSPSPDSQPIRAAHELCADLKDTIINV